MCGIAGILDNCSKKTQENLNEALKMMLFALEHRGPDDDGNVKIEGKNGLNLFLGHQRLSVISPGPGGHQPMHNDDLSVWVSTNSEIYNYKELKKELAHKYSFRSNSDTEVLLRSYEEWGLDLLNKISGMFAFAIWDGPKNKLILARDRIGIKPLYYHYKENILVFGSELRSILASKLVKPALNPSGIFQYLSYGRVGPVGSILDSITELQPGHFLIADKNGIQIQKYWDPFHEIKTIQSTEQFVNKLENCLEEVVLKHLVSDVPIGTFLSGGIDSSAIVSIISDKTTKPIETLSIIFENKDFDESKYSSSFAENLG
ncbi:uncharacterized protein METZ01_LOCUS283034, partial [marine metagenome]